MNEYNNIYFGSWSWYRYSPERVLPSVLSDWKVWVFSSYTHTSMERTTPHYYFDPSHFLQHFTILLQAYTTALPSHIIRSPLHIRPTLISILSTIQTPLPPPLVRSVEFPAFPANSDGELHILLHNSHPLRVDSAEVGVLEQTHDVRLGGLLQSQKRLGLEPADFFLLESWGFFIAGGFLLRYFRQHWGFFYYCRQR